MSTLTPFAYGDHPVRVVTIAGEPWFVLADLVSVLGFARSASAVSERLDDGVRQTYPILDSLGRTQQATIVSEAGMYEVVIRSDKPEAAQFRRWITTEVLPAIRKHGGYLTLEATEAALTDPDFIIRLATSLKEERAIRAEAEALAEDRRARLALVEPKALAFDRWLSSNVNYSVETVAKAIAASGVPMGRQRLFAYMADLGWIYRGDRAMWTPYQSQLETGRLAVKLSAVTNDRTGELFATTTVRITPKGARDLAVKLGALPESVAEALDDAA